MKTFDLTFKGTVLPEHDPRHVKARFAQLFCIEDLSVVEELFSGETIILRSDLDRKSAAEYFRKITQLGGEAELIESAEQHAAPGQLTVKLEQDTASTPRIIREKTSGYGMDREILIRRKGEVDQSWPVSSSRIDRQRQDSIAKKEQQKTEELAEKQRQREQEQEAARRVAEEHALRIKAEDAARVQAAEIRRSEQLEQERLTAAHAAQQQALADAERRTAQEKAQREAQEKAQEEKGSQGRHRCQP